MKTCDVKKCMAIDGENAWWLDVAGKVCYKKKVLVHLQAVPTDSQKQIACGFGHHRLNKAMGSSWHKTEQNWAD